MSRAVLTPWDAFVPLWNDLWFALGPTDRRDFVERGQSYHDVLREVRVDALRVAIDRVKREATMRAIPAPGVLLRFALEHEAALRDAVAGHRREERVDDGIHCPGGCGGKRWHEILLDAEGRIRRYPADVAEQAAPVALLDRNPAYRDALRGLAGQPMLRAHQTCSCGGRVVDDARGLHHWGQHHEDGCAVYARIPRPARKELAA